MNLLFEYLLWIHHLDLHNQSLFQSGRGSVPFVSVPRIWVIGTTEIGPRRQSRFTEWYSFVFCRRFGTLAICLTFYRHLCFFESVLSKNCNSLCFQRFSRLMTTSHLIPQTKDVELPSTFTQCRCLSETFTPTLFEIEHGCSWILHHQHHWHHKLATHTT